MKAVSNCLYQDIPIWIFQIEDVPELPPGFYYVIGVDFDAVEEGETMLGNVGLSGPFGVQRDAQEEAIAFIDKQRAELDQAEAGFYFDDED